MLAGIHNAVVIFNPAAGRLRRRGIARLAEVVAIFRAQGIAAKLCATERPGSATQLARDAVAQGLQLVVVCGGDGTMNEVVNGLAGSQVPMALLPGGTANVLGKELRLAWDLPTAARQIVAGTCRRIALAQAWSTEDVTHARWFLTLAGAGVDADMVYRVNEGLKKRAGVLAYWAAGIQQLTQYSYPLFRVEFDGKRGAGSLLIIGRTRAHGFPVSVTDRADLFGADFELALFRHRTSWRAFVQGCAALVHQLRRLHDVEFHRATEMECTPLNGATIRVQVDGELIGALPMRFRVVPDMLTLVVP